MTIMKIAGAQLGAIQKDDSRESVVIRMIALLDEAASKGADMVVYPELALTTFFPRWYMEDQAEIDFWFETEMPNAATQPLFDRARELKRASAPVPFCRDCILTVWNPASQKIRLPALVVFAVTFVHVELQLPTASYHLQVTAWHGGACR